LHACGNQLPGTVNHLLQMLIVLIIICIIIQQKKQSRPGDSGHLRMSTLRHGFAVLLIAASSGCGGGGDTSSGTCGTAATALSAAAQLGDLIFNDKELSVSGRQSCATCHVARFAFAAAVAAAASQP
jgi:cytochrome c553